MADVAERAELAESLCAGLRSAPAATSWAVATGVIQWVDRADRPKPKVLIGRRAAIYELVTRGAVSELRLERRIPAALHWPSGGAPIAEAVAEAVAERRTA